MNKRPKPLRLSPGAAEEGTSKTSQRNSNCNTKQFRNPTPIPVRRTDGKKVGELVDDILTKEARARVHMLRRPQRAWAWDMAILRWAEEQGVRWTEITDLDSGKVYRAAIADFWAHGFTLDRGYGKQRALPVGYWKVRRPSESPSPQPVQLTLPFGGGP